MKRVLAIVFLAVGAIYVGDFLSARFAIPGHRQIYGTVMVEQTLAVPLKDKKKEEYFFQPAQPETCLYSLFPHFGYPPCWYLQRHTSQRVDM